MRAALASMALCALLLASGCATAYAPQQLTGGFSQSQLAPGLWRVTFAGNGYTTQESAQTYWLYRCATLTLQQGYAGFQIVTAIDLTQLRGRGGAAVTPAAYTYQTDQPPKPMLSAEIRMLKPPFAAHPPRSFDADALAKALDPYVNGQKCDGNVCPHFHGYLYPPSQAPAAAPGRRL